MPKIKPAPNDGLRFDRNSWLRYRPIVSKWVETYPKPFKVRPNSLSPETVSCRVRDAVRGYLTFHWAPDDVDIERLKEIWLDTSVVAFGDSVLFKSSTSETQAIQIQDDNDFLFSIDNPTRKELIAVTLLANNEKLSQRKVLLDSLTPELSDFLVSPEFAEAFPNVIIQALSKNKYTIL